MRAAYAEMLLVDGRRRMLFRSAVKHVAGWSFVFLVPALMSAGCSVATPESRAAGLSSSSSSSSKNDGAPFTVPWGAGGMTLRPAVAEQLALGPSSVAIAADGSALVLDNWGGAVWRVTADRATKLTTMPRDTEDVIAWRDGAFAVYRPLSRGVDLFARDGSARGSLQIPRAVTDVAWLEAGPSHRVLVQDPFQETVTLGSPHAPLDEASVLRSRRDGVFGGFEVIVTKGDARLRVLDTAQSERKRVRREHRLGRDVRSAQIVGAENGVVCARLERGGEPTEGAVGPVGRRAVCVDAETGAVQLDVALPAVGSYVPRRELALGGTPLSLVHIEPGAAGLTVRRWEVRR